jgi:hypothetical protein
LIQLPPLPHPSASFLSFSPVELTDRRREEGVGEKAKLYDLGKVCPSINHSILSGSKHRMVWFAEPVVEQNFFITIN